MLKRIAYLRNIRGLPRQAAKLLRRYLSLAPARARSAKLYLLLANLYVDVGETKKAFAAFRTAARKARVSSDELLLADILRKWGYLYLHTEEEPRKKKAARKIQEAVDIIVRLLKRGETKEKLQVAANCYASLGNYYWILYLFSGDEVHLQAAKRAYWVALQFAYKSEAKERAITILGDLGNVAIREKDWEGAEELLLSARDGAEKYYKHALPAALLRLGYLFLNPENPSRDLKKAERFFGDSLGVARKSGWKREQADALKALGKIKEAEEIYRSIGYKSHLKAVKAK